MGDDAQLTEEERARVERLAAELDKRITENDDGSFVVRLVRPIRRRELSRVTLRPVRVADMRAVRGASGIEAAERYAERLVQPEGALDELETDADLAAVLRATDRALGKYLGSGQPSSQ